MFPVDEKFSQIYMYQAFAELARLISGGNSRSGKNAAGRPIIEVRLARLARNAFARLLLWVADILIRAGNGLKEACYLPNRGLAK